jgi:hypothetical protein
VPDFIDIFIMTALQEIDPCFALILMFILSQRLVKAFYFLNVDSSILSIYCLLLSHLDVAGLVVRFSSFRHLLCSFWILILVRIFANQFNDTFFLNI